MGVIEGRGFLPGFGPTALGVVKSVHAVVTLLAFLSSCLPVSSWSAIVLCYAGGD